MKQGKWLYLEAARILAVLLVIFNHTDGFFLYYTHTHSGITYGWSLFLSVLCRVNVPLFFMISGALLLKKEETAKELFQKRVSRIAAAIVLFSFLQYGVDWARGRESAFSLFVFLRKILAGDIEETYWFLYAYLGILLLLPLVRRLARAMTDADFRYLLALETALAVGLPLFGALTGLSVSSWLFVWNTNVFYLLAGFWLSGREEKTAEEEKRIFVQSCLAAAVVIGLSCVVV